ncbi:UBP1-ASSOCIATED PROTEIN 2A-LIKE [Salix koriyanagi]|uniref:UBP1-ASSOCIATED PROTEIN 2A-LIKE n=1 Tax=Salix koriyanagi TaxID=2511006 RepID=A0A9Q0SMK0_9ROSI|nr:UBP1-ASSOCIATED PROTEIN 2A-LIKE [Salix koriyanagi]
MSLTGMFLSTASPGIQPAKTSNLPSLPLEKSRNAMLKLKEWLMTGWLVVNWLLWDLLMRPSAAKGKELDGGVRKIFVSNVGMGTDKEKLRAFFEKFGEIENGPIGFDKGDWETVEGAIKALEEPHKIFEGQQLRCSVATEGKHKTIQNVPQGMQQQRQQQQGHQHPQGQFLAAAQNLALFGQHPGFNPFYSALLGNTGVGGGMLSPVIGQSVVPTATSQVRGLGAGSQSTLEAYRAAQVLQHVYSSTTQFGQTGMGRGQGADGSFAGYPKYMWYGLSKLDFSVAIQRLKPEAWISTCEVQNIPSYFDIRKDLTHNWL